MANKSLFASLKSLLPRVDARNEEGARAYQLPPKQALAQLAATGCFNGTFYAQSEDQLATLLALVNQVDDNLYLAKLAIYSRERAFMKDMPAALLLGIDHVPGRHGLVSHAEQRDPRREQVPGGFENSPEYPGPPGSPRARC